LALTVTGRQYTVFRPIQKTQDNILSVPYDNFVNNPYRYFQEISLNKLKILIEDIFSKKILVQSY